MAEAESPRLRLFACLLLIVTLAWVMTGCGNDAGAVGADSSGSTEALSAKETKQLLRQLPYRYKFRFVAIPEGAEAAVAGRAVGHHRTILNFGIALGHGYHGVPVPHARTINPYGYSKGGFIFTNDVLIRGPDGRLTSNPHFHTVAQWDEASSMSVAMTDKLCLAATGEHCPP
jgi:hypothetical protein